MNNIKLNDVIEKIDHLPEVFSVAVKVAKQLEDLDTKVEDLAATISTDQALTTKLLKLCNSAKYGYSKKIVTIKDAIPKLGFKTIKSLIFLTISQSVLYQELKGYDLEKESLWENSVSCAVYARYLAKLSNYPDPETAFTAGLIRDIGKLIVHEYIGESYEQIVDIVNTKNVSFSEAESEVLEFNHCEIGAKVAEKWNFPTVLIDAIRYHHSPNLVINMPEKDKQLISIVHVADAVTMMLGSGMGNDGMMYKIEMNAMEQLKFPANSSSIESLISDMVELNTEITEMIGMINEH